MTIDSNIDAEESKPVSHLQQAIARQRNSLIEMLKIPMGGIARECSRLWPQHQWINQALQSGLHEIPYCQFLYAMDTHARQISDNISHDGLLTEHFERDRSTRPYMSNLNPEDDFTLSEAYMSLRAHRPSVTAVQVVRKAGQFVGYIGADFDLRNLPLTRELYEEPSQWKQIKGDPSIRSQVFLQKRSESILDRRIKDIIPIIEELVVDHGIFHVKIHFSSSRAVIWLVDDPFRYRLLDIDALTDPGICLAYPRMDYPEDAVIPADKVGVLLDGFRRLRFGDESIYLRAAGMNIFNGMVSLNFSCDGSHYIPYAEFLDKDVSFWGLSPG